MTRPSPPAWQVWTALWLVYVLWGSTYLGIAYVVEDLPPLLAASLRFTCAALLLAAWIAARRGPRRLLAPPRQWLRAAGLVPLVRAPSLDAGWIGRALDAGARAGRAHPGRAHRPSR